MNALQNICSRYETGTFTEPNRSFWRLPASQNSATKIETAILINLILSISHYALNLLANLHNKLMASDHSKWVKIAVVILLNLAAMALIALALAETMFRLALTVISLPFIALACIWDCGDGINAMLSVPLITSALTIIQIPNAFNTAFNFTTQNSNVQPITFTSAAMNKIFCGAFDNAINAL